MKSLFLNVLILVVTSTVCSGKRNHVIELTDENWFNMLEGQWMVKL